MRLFEYVLRRIAISFVLLFGLSLLVFYLERGAVPPVTWLYGFISVGMTPVQMLHVAQSIGVAYPNCPSWSAFTSYSAQCVVPWWQQYIPWLRIFLSVDLGNVFAIYVSAGTVTFELVILSLILILGLGIPIGIFSATHRNSFSEGIVKVLSLLGSSTPIFWLGNILTWVFVWDFRIGDRYLLPSPGNAPTQCLLCLSNMGVITRHVGIPLIDSLLSLNFAYFWDTLLGLALPVLTLALTYLAMVVRMTRSGVLDALKQDYVVFARSKGIRERTVVYRHALRNGILPTITAVAWISGSLLAGSVVVEDIFFIHGIGSIILSSSLSFYAPVVTDLAVSFGLIIVLVNLCTDILYAIIDPRIRY